MVLEVILQILKKICVRRAQDEALVSYDFLLIPQRQSLMQFCFSILNRWWIFLLIGLIAVSPFRYHLSVHQLWGIDHWMVSVMYSGQLLIPFVSFLFLSIILRSHTLAVLILFYLQAQGDIHILFGLAALSGIFLADARRLLKKSTLIVGLVRRIVLWGAGLQLLTLLISSFLYFYLYQYLYNLGFFSGTMYQNRFEFLVIALLIHYFIQFLGVSVWGHFYTQKKTDPSIWNLKYSTGAVLNIFWLSSSFKQDLNRVIQDKLASTYHQKPEEQKGIPQKLVEHYLEEKTFLQDAQTHLS